MITPRDYQDIAIAQILAALETDRSTLAVLPTGTGKMVIAAFVINHFRQFGDVLFLAHRGELLEQAQAKISAVSGIWPELEKAENYADLDSFRFDDSGGRVIVSSIQTQISGYSGWRRRDRFKPENFVLVVIDEAHRGPSDSYIDTFDYYKQNQALKIVGFTATPNRTDRKALGKIFDSVSVDIPILDSINAGWLVPPSVHYTTIHGLDLSNVKTTAGDLNQGDLAKIMEVMGPLNDIATATIDKCGTRKTVVFTVSVEQARLLTEILNQHKPYSARYVTGKTPDDERRHIMREFRSGEYQYLVNVGVLTEGIDIPDISAVVMARPTKSSLVFAQQIGRALRPLDGLVDRYGTPLERRQAIAGSAKPEALIVDLVGNSGKHKLVRLTDVLGGRYSDEVRKLAERKLQNSSKPEDVKTALEEAQKEIDRKQQQAAERLAKSRERAKVSSQRVDPFDNGDIHAPIWKHHAGFIPATEPQIKLCAAHGIDASKLSKHQCSGIIGKLMNQEGGRPATVKQEKFLRWKRAWKDGMRFSEASQKIEEINRSGGG